MAGNLMRNKNTLDDFFDVVFSGKPGEALDRFFEPVRGHIPAVSLPFVNMRDVEGGIEVDIAAPGLTKDAFDVRVKDSKLRVSAKKETKSSDDGNIYRYREHNYSEFTRFVELPKNASTVGVKASYTDGILKIFVPTETEPDVVEIEVE